MKNLLIIFICLLAISACDKNEPDINENPLEKFLGSYEVDFTCNYTNTGGTLTSNYNEVFFVELPNENSGLGDNYLVFRNLLNDDDYNFIVNGNDFQIDFIGETPVARGYYENGNLIFTEVIQSNNYVCDVPVTATKR